MRKVLIAICLLLSSVAWAISPGQLEIQRYQPKAVYKCDYKARGALCGGETFSRAGNATMFDATGALTYAPANMLANSNSFSNATYWTLTNATAPSGVADPFGGSAASALTEDGTAGGHSVANASGTAGVAGATYIASVYIQYAGTRRYIGVQASGAGLAANEFWVFDSQNPGSLTQVNGSVSTATVTAIGGGWYRAAIRFTAVTTNSIFLTVSGMNGSAYANRSYAGANGTIAAYAGFAQIEPVTYATTPSTYNPTTSAAYYGPRFDNTPAVANSPLGLEIEESRTNSIRNSTMQGAVAGSPGTLPTNWIGPGLGTLTQTLAYGTEYGMPYVDVRLNGTTSTTNAAYYLDATNFIAAVNGQTWVASAYYKLAGGSLTNIDFVRIVAQDRTAANAVIGQTTVNITPTSSLQRGSISRATSGTTAFMTGFVGIYFSSGVAIDITLRIYQPQLELGAFATSAIPTYGAALTRAADVVTLSGAPLQIYGANQGAVVIEAIRNTAAGAATRYLDDGQKLFYLSTATPPPIGLSNDAGVTALLDTTGVSAVGVNQRAVASWVGTNGSLAANGDSVSKGAIGTRGATGTLYLGNSAALDRCINGWVRGLSFYNVPLNDNTLRAKSVVGSPY
jgi:hypothetical protein